MTVAARSPSLVFRLVLALATVSVLLSGAAALALDALFREVALAARRDVLDAQVIALIATAELGADGSLVPATIAEARLTTPGSGLYAEIRDATGASAWRSPSSAGSGLRLLARPAAGRKLYEQVALADGTRILALSLGVSWETGRGPPATFSISAAESLEPYFAETARVRGWLLAGALGLMLALVSGLYAGLKVGLEPLARLEKEIGDVEAGRRDRLGDGWPRELAGVTQNLNALLEGERARLGRYRTTLGNLAHSLKTPIAALQTMLGAGSLDAAAVSPQVERMQSIVEHQLRRAVLAGGGSTVAAIPVRPPLVELAAALGKVYRDKPIHCELDVPASLSYPIESGDFMELAGNLLDNACKYGGGRVLVQARPEERPQWRRPGLLLSVDDDGPGISATDRLRVLERGVRADESVAGQGIGLAATRELVHAYGGTIEIGDSRLGGATVRVRLPGR